MTESQTRSAESFRDLAGEKVYMLLEEDKAVDNVCYSPLSMQLALSMFAHDCGESISEETSQKVLEFLGIADFDELDEFNRLLLRELPKVDGMVKFTLSNSVWRGKERKIQQEGFPWLSVYDAEMFDVDFNDPGVVKQINEWTLGKTGNKIKLYDDNADIKWMDMLYVNALHFLGKWSVPFEEGQEKMDFTDVDGNIKKVDRLYWNMATGGSGYSKEKKTVTGDVDGRHFAKIPFGKGGYSMYVVLPKEDESVADCANFIIGEGLCLEDRTEVSSGEITLPAFETQLDIEGIQEKLVTLGFPINFVTDSGRSATMNVKQKTYFKVTKDGAEGAGTTSVAISLGVPKGDVDVNFNRPFVYYVMEQSTGTVLFIGSVKKF
ncbi:MAG: hypothetical protein K2G52_04990 [Muribaculaceae bacterium]|nr:hypothetical protein [Muribaculaceae bacterium]